jgi:hypothetical protein
VPSTTPQTRPRAVPHHKLKGKKRSIVARSALQYLDRVVIVDGEGLGKILQGLLLVQLWEHEGIQVRQSCLCLHQQPLNLLAGVDDERDNIGYGINVKRFRVIHGSVSSTSTKQERKSQGMTT